MAGLLWYSMEALRRSGEEWSKASDIPQKASNQRGTMPVPIGSECELFGSV